MIEPFGAEQIFEFDADLEDDTLAIVGTIPAGLIAIEYSKRPSFGNAPRLT